MTEATQAYDRYNVLYTTFDCSDFAELFVCLSLAPQCENDVARPPCASFCDVVKARCNEAILQRGGFGFDVYCLLDCSRQVRGMHGRPARGPSLCVGRQVCRMINYSQMWLRASRLWLGS